MKADILPSDNTKAINSDADMNAILVNDAFLVKISSFLRLFISISAYLLVGPLLIFLNRYILNDLDFHYPASLSSLGVLFSWLISWICVHILKIVKLEYWDVMTPNFYLTRILPISLFQVLTLLFGNWVYLYLSVSLIQMLKSFTPAMVMVLTYLFRISKPTRYLILSTLCICFGTSLTSIGSIQYSFIGFVFMFAAEFFEAIRLVLIQTLLGSAGWSFSVMEGLYWISPASLFWTWLVVIPVIELKELRDGNALEIALGNIEYLFLAGLLGFSVNVMGYFVIRTSGALMLKILSTIRNLGVIMYSVFILHEIVTMEQFFGMIISLGGFIAFNYLQMNKLGEVPYSSQPTLPEKSVGNVTYSQIQNNETKENNGIDIDEKTPENSNLVERSHISLEMKPQR